MSNNSRVFNVTRGFTMKCKQALRAVEECACEWVEKGVSVRDLTLAESIAKRAEQNKLRSPLELSELHGLKWQPPINDVITRRERSALIHQAHQFAEQCSL